MTQAESTGGAVQRGGIAPLVDRDESQWEPILPALFSLTRESQAV